MTTDKDLSPVQCPECSRRFAAEDHMRHHYRAKHGEPDEPSMASRIIEAQLQFAMGGPVDEDWLLDGFY